MDDIGAKRVALMLRHLGLVPDPNARPPASNAHFPFPRQSEQPAQPSEPNIVRWAREQREQEALRSRFPHAFPPKVASPPKESYPTVLPERTRAFLQQQYPSVDWSRVVTRQGGNLPGSSASTDHNLVSFSKPIDQTKVADFFHEMGHIPDWFDGSLTKPKYIAEAILSAVRYATKTSGTYGMYPTTKMLPDDDRDPAKAIWKDIPYEKQAEERGQRWARIWEAAGEKKIR